MTPEPDEKNEALVRAFKHLNFMSELLEEHGHKLDEKDLKHKIDRIKSFLDTIYNIYTS